MSRLVTAVGLGLVSLTWGCGQPSPVTEPAKAGTAPAVAPAVAKPARPAMVTGLADVEHRQKGGGAAQIWALARGENAFLGKLEMAAGGKVPEHRDPTEEYIHILTGGGTFTIDGQVHQVGPGTTIYMPPGALVSFENGPEPLVAIQVFAGPEPAAKYDAWEKVP